MTTVRASPRVEARISGSCGSTGRLRRSQCCTPGAYWADSRLRGHRRATRLRVGEVLHRRAALAVGRDEELEVMRARGELDRRVHLDAAALEVLEEVLVEGLHPVERALGDDLRKLPGLVGVHDHVAH